MSKKYRDIKAWRNNTRQKIFEAFSGKCAICKLEDHPCAYDLHHLDPSMKEFAVSGKIKSWEKIVTEAKKCRLLCAICHRKLHKGIVTLPADAPEFDEVLVVLDPRAEASRRRCCPILAGKRICPRCDGEKNKSSTLCAACSGVRKNIDWGNLDLPKLLAEHGGVVSRMARALGVSDNGLKKQLVKRGIR